MPTNQPFEANRYSEIMGWWIRDFVNNPYRIALVRNAANSSCSELLKKGPLNLMPIGYTYECLVKKERFLVKYQV